MENSMNILKTFLGRDSFYINILHLHIIFIFSRELEIQMLSNSFWLYLLRNYNKKFYLISLRFQTDLKSIVKMSAPTLPNCIILNINIIYYIFINIQYLHDNLVRIALGNNLKIFHRSLKYWSALNGKDGQTD